MAEKAFKVPSLGLVGTTAELDFASGDLRWNTLPLATESYVDSAIAGVTVNTNAVAASLVGTGLFVQNGDDLVVNTNLIATQSYVDSAVSNATVNVEAIAGPGLIYTPTGGDLAVNAGTGLFIENDAVLVDANAVAYSLAGTGLYRDMNAGNLAVNTNVIATRAYVDAVAEGLHIHESVRAATTGPVALATDLEAGDTLDTNVTLIAGDRILVKNQATASENGIYVVQASGQPTRATDFDTATEVDSGDFVFVREGATQAGTGWVQINQPATIGTDPIAFSQFSGAGTYTAGNGLDLTGNVFSVNTGLGLWLANDAIQVNTNAIAQNLVGAGLFVDGSDDLAVLLGSGLSYDGSNNNAIRVNTSIVAQDLVGTGLYVTSGDDLTVNTNTIAQSLVGTGLYVTSGDNLTVNANSVAASVAPVLGTIAGGYGAFWEFYIEGANSTNRTTMTTGGISDWTASDTYAVAHLIELGDYFVRSTQTSAGQIDADNVGAFEAEVVITLIDGNAVTKKRVSKILGTYSGSTVDYTEFAIVEHGGSIPGVDVLLEYSMGAVDVKVKATIDFNNAETLYATVNARTFGNHSFAL